MALLAWWSAPEAKLITNNEKINELSHFVQMLQNVPVSSNFEVIIMFPGQNFIQIVIHGDNVRKMELKEIILEIFALDGIKFGSFQLKNGIISPIYFDMRVIISQPKLMKEVSRIMWDRISEDIVPYCDYTTDILLCGVPYTALPIATLISAENGVPMVMRRKEMKDYGTKKMIEGAFSKGQYCLIIEDVITSGSSVIETAEILRKEGMQAKQVVVFLDRQQGGKLNLEKNDLNVRSVVTVNELLDILLEAGKVKKDQKAEVENFLQNNSYVQLNHSNNSPKILSSVMKMNLPQRMENSHCSVVKKLFGTMMEKESNLCLAVDVTTCQELLDVATKLASKICVLKTHVDMLNDWHPDMIIKLKKLSEEKNFMLFEDRKLADIGNTVQAQFHQGLYQISSWADFVTIHGLPGPGLLQSITNSSKCKALIVAEMSSKENLADSNYAKKCVEMIMKSTPEENAAVGIIAQSRLEDSRPDIIQMTPGVQLQSKGDLLGQTYNTPSNAINRGADIIIVGRGITKHSDPLNEAEKYRREGWKSLMERVL